MMTATDTDNRIKFLTNELNRLQVRLIYVTEYMPAKIGYIKEQIEITQYELNYFN